MAGRRTPHSDAELDERIRQSVHYTAAMAIPPDVLAEAETALTAFCAQHSSAAGGDLQRFAYEIESSSALLNQQRPGFMAPDTWSSKPIAKFRYSQARHNWSLYWADSSERWHRVANVPAAKDIQVLLAAVLADPLGVFWS